MIIIGAGRVGGALAERAAQASSEQAGCEQAGCEHLLVDRTSGWDAIADSTAPIFVAVRNDDLDAVIERVPADAHERLVFTQNGMLRPWLDARGLGDCTRGLLFFAVASRGAPLVPGGQSPFVGPHASAVVAWLERIGVPACEVEPAAFAVTELEKLLWNCCFGLLCEHVDGTVGAVVNEHHDLLDSLADELLAVGMPAFGLALEPQERQALKERLAAYSLSIADYRGAVKEWPWRNGWFVAAATQPGLHERLLTETGHLPR